MQYYDNLLNESNKLRELRKVQIDEMIKQGVSRSDAEKRAVTPTFANSETEAAELFGGYKGDDWKATSGSEKGWAKATLTFDLNTNSRLVSTLCFRAVHHGEEIDIYLGDGKLDQRIAQIGKDKNGKPEIRSF